MQSKFDYLKEIDEKFLEIKRNIFSYSESVTSIEELHSFYDNCLNEFYKFMPYYTFKLAQNLSDDDFLYVNQCALDKSNELHLIYTKLFNEIKENLP